MELTLEHWDTLDTWGISAGYIHQALEFVLTNSYFTYNTRLYRQLVGLFMGCKPSPLAAISRMFVYERKSIYLDQHLTFYGRYVDDAGSFARTREEAEQFVSTIAEQDPDGLLKWEVDFPSEGEWTPFLDAEIRVVDGTVQHRFYRKPQKKPITLHHDSHHSTATKIATVRNFYRTAKLCSSSPENEEHSLRIVDHLLINNGYENPREMNKRRLPRPPTTSQSDMDCVTLTLPFISDSFTNHIQSFIKSHHLPIRLILRPGTTLHSLFCSSRPYDRPKCTITGCEICPLMSSEKYDCSVQNVVYKLTCKLCDSFYIGECMRSLHQRIGEHRRAAIYPSKYSGNSMGKHYAQEHSGIAPVLSLEVLATGLSKTVKRKIAEAEYIQTLKPTINSKSECVDVLPFLTRF